MRFFSKKVKRASTEEPGGSIMWKWFISDYSRYLSKDDLINLTLVLPHHNIFFCNINITPSRRTLTPLHVACKEGNNEQVTKLLDLGFEIDAKDKDGYTPLHYAAKFGHYEAARLLLEHGMSLGGKKRRFADPNICNKMNWSALATSINCGFFLISRLLTNHRCLHPNNYDPLPPMYFAIRSGKVKIVEQAIIAGYANPKWYITDAVRVAADLGYVDIVRELRKVLRGRADYTVAMRAAVDRGHLNVVKALYEMNCDIKAVLDPKLNQTALHRCRDPAMLDVFLPRVSWRIIDSTGKTPLHVVARSGLSECAKRLVQAGNEVNWTDKQGQTPLHAAAMSASLRTVQAIIDTAPPGTVNMNAVDNMGHTPLYLAAEYGRVRTVRYFMELGAVFGECPKWPPIHAAARGGHNDVLAELTGKGHAIDYQNDRGTVLHVAAFYGKSETVKELVRRGADLNAVNKDGKTPLHLAAEQGNSETIRMLKVLGADFYAKNKKGKTPLQVAQKRVSREIIVLCNYVEPVPS